MSETIPEDWYKTCENYECEGFVGKCDFGEGEATIVVYSKDQGHCNFCVLHFIKWVDENAAEMKVVRENEDGTFDVVVYLQD